MVGNSNTVYERRHYKESVDKGYNLLDTTHEYYPLEDELDPVTGPLKACGTRAVRADCHHGCHSFAKVLYYGREWCPICGANDSAIHRQRYARLLPKAQTMERMGYLVIEWKNEHREQLATVAQLRAVRRQIIRHLKHAGYDREITRWHFYGDKIPGKYNPHLNILIPTGGDSWQCLGSRP